MGALAVPRFTVEEYLAADRVAELPSEYHDGVLFPIEAASLRHSRILGNTTSELRTRLRGSPCEWAVSPIRVRVSPTKFIYPDLLVYCGEPALTDEHADTLTNPKVIVEVLSPSTADYDYGTKFRLYQLLPSFEEYVLISQFEQRVEVGRRVEDRWTLTTYKGPDGAFPIESIGIEIPFAEVYAGTAKLPSAAGR